MTPDGLSSDFNKILLVSSSESSDSESLLPEDIKSSGNQINKQWEAIERTLYQEPGQQVTDPELLKECKLWRETFPHFRVKGTKIDLKPTENEVQETDKNVQTVKNHFNLKKLEEKRKNIKQKVVGVLVERLIAKYNLGKEENANSEIKKNSRNGVQTPPDTDEDSSGKLSYLSPKNKINKSIYKNSERPSVINTDKESYFERGKSQNKNAVQEEEFISVQQMERNLYEIFDSWERESKSATKVPKNCDSKKSSYPSTRENFTVRSSEKPNKYIPSSSSLEKPFEMTKRIDKKFEGLIEKIMERKYNEFDAIRHCRTSASGLEMKSYQESLEKLRKGSGFDDYIKRKDMLKINKFNNNWLKRNEANGSYPGDNFFPKKTQSIKFVKPSNNLNFSSENSQEEPDEKFFRELKKEMHFSYKRPAKKSGIVEEIALRRPKPFTFSTEKTSKSSSCRDLNRKNKKDLKGRLNQNGLNVGKSESNFNRVRSNNLHNSRGSKSNGNKNPLLPPIESGIICTELTGRPKIGPKNSTKRY